MNIEIKNFFFNICFFLDPSRKNKCNEFIDELLSVLYFIVNSNLFIILLIFFLVITFKLIILKTTDRYIDFLLPCSIFILFFFILINFKTNLPWVDDWEWIENLQTNKISVIDWLFQPTNIHNIFFIKLIFLINNNFFNLNFALFNYLSVIIIFLLSYFFIKNEKIDNKIYLSFFIVLIFSGKQFANFSQASNLAWTICFFYIILFNYFLKSNQLIKIILCSLIIFIAPLTFGLGYVLPLFILSFVYFFKLDIKVKINYIILSILGILFSYLIPKLLFDDLVSLGLNFNSFEIFLKFSFYLTFFGVLSNVFLPWIEGFAYLGSLIGLLQILIISFIISNNYNQIGFVSLNNFINNNILIILGLIFAFIVSFTRSDLQTVVAARYSVGSIIFQLGFWLFLFKENKFIFIKNINFIKLLTIYIFLSGVLFPYNGIHWQAKRHISNNLIVDCYKNNIKNVIINNCNKLAYDTLFYDGKWYNFKIFENQIKVLKEKNKSFLNF